MSLASFLIPYKKLKIFFSMKQIFSILLLLIAGITSAQEINWMSMNEALNAQKKNPKKIFIDV